MASEDAQTETSKSKSSSVVKVHWESGVKSFKAVLLVSVILILSCSYAATSLTGPLEHSAPIHPILSDSSSSPTIDWFGPPENSTAGYTTMWDGIYTGQTQEVWSFEIWVHDPDDVDCVLFRFLRFGASQWENKTAELIEGNSTSGLYAGNLTYSVEWNPGMEYPNPSSFAFSFKVFANDSLGSWAETTTVTYIGGYWFVSIPSTTTIPSDPYGWLFPIAVGAGFSIAAIVCVLRSKRV